MSTANAPPRYCQYCGNLEHGSAACSTVTGMPSSPTDHGSVVKALEMITAFIWRTRPELQIGTVLSTVLEALPLAHEQEVLLLAYMESHRIERRGWAIRNGREMPEDCSCDLCERARKVLR